jgi:hypothetical protein
MQLRMECNAMPFIRISIGMVKRKGAESMEIVLTVGEK